MLNRIRNRRGAVRSLVLALGLVAVTTLSGCVGCHGGDWLVAPLAAYVIVDALQHCWCH